MAFPSKWSRTYARRYARKTASNPAVTQKQVINYLQSALNRIKGNTAYYTQPYRSTKKAWVSIPRKRARFRRAW